jgi:hypothetical protein
VYYMNLRVWGLERSREEKDSSTIDPSRILC